MTEAARKVTIVTPYFIPHRWLVKAIRKAAARGVIVEVILPDQSDVWVTTLANHLFAREFHKFIQFFFIPKMIHAKVLLIDDHEGLVGSNNIDAQSFDFNMEASIVFQRKDMVGDLKTILNEWKKMALPLALDQHAKKWWHKIIRCFIKILQPII